MPLDLRPLLAQNSIVAKDKSVKKLDINEEDEYGWCQVGFIRAVERQYNSGKPVRIIILKARQLGMSTVTEAILFNWLFIHPHTNALVVTHENKATLSLFQKTKMYWDTWPFKNLYHTKYATKFGLNFSNGSDISVATAKNVQSGRGSTIHALHLSEFAFYPDPLGLMSGLNQTIPDEHGTIVVIESTAQGTGNMFHEMWDQACAGEIDYLPLFFPWWMHNGYRNHAEHLDRDSFDDYEEWLFNLCTTIGYEDYEGTHTITPDEAMEAIAWRRWAIPNKLYGDEDKFMEEYPATPDEAFIASGRPIFPPRFLRDCFVKPRNEGTGFLRERHDGTVIFEHQRGGPLTIFKAPSRRDTRSDRYFVSGDPSRSLEGDPACMQVINRATFEQVAVYHNNIDPVTFGHEMELLGRFYHECMVCPEVEGGGQATIAILLDHNYPNIWQHRWADKAPGKLSTSFGWSTSFNRKNWCIGFLKKLILERQIIIHDYKTYAQLRDYVQHDDSSSMGNATPGGHDDAVMALAIGVTASQTEGPFMDDRASASVITDMFSGGFTDYEEDSTYASL
jgi:hypothetical protein